MGRMAIVKMAERQAANESIELAHRGHAEHAGSHSEPVQNIIDCVEAFSEHFDAFCQSNRLLNRREIDTRQLIFRFLQPGTQPLGTQPLGSQPLGSQPRNPPQATPCLLDCQACHAGALGT